MARPERAVASAISVVAGPGHPVRLGLDTGTVERVDLAEGALGYSHESALHSRERTHLLLRHAGIEEAEGNGWLSNTV
jgi:hypothetical protein